MNFIICIGNGLHANDTTSAMNEKIVEKALKFWEIDKAQKIILCGGYKNQNGVTEAKSMENYLLSLHPYAKYIRENKSYRTHNNAIEAMKIVRNFGGKGAEVVIVDHPQHLRRTLLSFQVVNRIYHHDAYKIIGSAANEVYDSTIPGQEYWATAKSFKEYEKSRMLLFRFLLWKPWARIGMKALLFIWPSEKQ